MKKLLEYWKISATLFVALTGLITWFTVTNATMDDVQLVAMRLDQKIIADHKTELQQTIWKLEDRHGCIDVEGCRLQMDTSTFEYYRGLKQKLQDMNNIEEFEIIKK